MNSEKQDGKFKRSIYSTECLKLIREKIQGDMIPYREIRELIGLNPQKEGRGYLATGRRVALNEYGIVTRAISNVGIEILTDDKIAREVSKQTLQRTRKMTRKGIREITAVKEFDGLDYQAKTDHNLAVSCLGLFDHIISPKQVKTLRNAVTQKALGFDATLKLFQE